MEMTPEEEEAFIRKEIEWRKNLLREKEGEMKIATKRYNEAKLVAEITQEALDDFLAKTKTNHKE